MTPLQPNPFYKWFEVIYQDGQETKTVKLYAYSGNHAFLGLVYGDKITHNNYKLIKTQQPWSLKNKLF